MMTRRPSNPLKSLILLMLEIFSSGNEVIFFGELGDAKSAEGAPTVDRGASRVPKKLRGAGFPPQFGIAGGDPNARVAGREWTN
jgi:hypothetical protein